MIPMTADTQHSCSLNQTGVVSVFYYVYYVLCILCVFLVLHLTIFHDCFLVFRSDFIAVVCSLHYVLFCAELHWTHNHGMKIKIMWTLYPPHTFLIDTIQIPVRVSSLVWNLETLTIYYVILFMEGEDFLP
jgi:hypothetical protein